MLTATRLRADHLTDPIGLGNPRPRLFWVCDGGTTQTAYRIVATRDGDTVWDSGKVLSSKMTGHEWGGSALHSRDRIQWQVQLWDEAEQPGPWTSTTFELGLLQPQDWVATWITGDYEPKKKHRYPVDQFRHSFHARTVASARLYVTACGVYDAHLNGTRVGDAVLAPGFTDYDSRLHYQAYDVTEQIADGANTIEVAVADGWYRGSIGALGTRNAYGTKTKLLAQLELTYADGRRDTISTGDGWEWSNDGALRFADLKDGERVDLTQTPSYRGVARETTYPLVPAAADNVVPREKERFTPTISRTPAGVQLLDFGQNIAGYIELTVDARHGEQLHLQFAEHLDTSGELDMAAIQVRAGKPNATPQQRIDLTLADGTNTYKTRFAVFGFRYATVTGDIELAAESVTAIAVYSDMGQTGAFTSSHALINQFVQNTLWSMKGNFLDVPTDCPTRERAPWTGDAQIFTRTGTFLMDTAAFMRKWLRDLQDRQMPNGRVPCVAPDTHNNEVFGMDQLKAMAGSAGWADAAVLVPWYLYELYRDEVVLRDSYDMMKRHVEFQITRTNRTGLFGRPFPKPDRKYISNAGQAFGEWLEPTDVYQQSILKDMIAPHPEEATAYLAYTTRIMADVARILGRDEDIPLFEEYARGCAEAYARQFTPVDTDRQSKMVRPLAFGLLEGQLADDTFAKLVNAIEAREYRIGTGFLSTPLILPVLSERGRTDIAYRMLENEAEPGWLFQVRSGATTVWENWDGTASQNHYSPGSVCQWIFETVCGVDVTGEQEFTIAPQPGGTLTHAAFSYDSVFGTVTSAWKRQDDLTEYEITVPSNTTAHIRLPEGTVTTVGAGTWVFREANESSPAAAAGVR
ncbi:family 78 glycoside hydrolase catalytic domain [Agromyces sp. Marseille-Q5079]|uniref:family 78 glycoside hydrolase catalytic domain n=1 Tax=Agromyces sp. Marseille-Q5079 TaxID=3439059 RepID=UPI003D9CAC3E